MLQVREGDWFDSQHSMKQKYIHDIFNRTRHQKTQRAREIIKKKTKSRNLSPNPKGGQFKHRMQRKKDTF